MLDYYSGVVVNLNSIIMRRKQHFYNNNFRTLSYTIFEKSMNWKPQFLSAGEILQDYIVQKNQFSETKLSKPNFHKATIRIESGEWAHYLIISRTGNETVYTGMFLDLIDALSESFNFTYTFNVNNDWGGVHNGKWFGMIRKVSSFNI